MLQYCTLCERQVPVEQFPICTPCLNAESIILHGCDINGNGRAITAQDKIKLLLEFNWKQGN